MKKDQAAAVHWYRKAAEQGEAAVQYNLAICYDIGSGVPKDFVYAYMWANLAAVGDPSFADYRDTIEAKLNKDMLMEAQRLSRKFHRT